MADTPLRSDIIDMLIDKGWLEVGVRGIGTGALYHEFTPDFYAALQEATNAGLGNSGLGKDKFKDMTIEAFRNSAGSPSNAPYIAAALDRMGLGVPFATAVRTALSDPFDNDGQTFYLPLSSALTQALKTSEEMIVAEENKRGITHDTVLTAANDADPRPAKLAEIDGGLPKETAPPPANVIDQTAQVANATLDLLTNPLGFKPLEAAEYTPTTPALSPVAVDSVFLSHDNDAALPLDKRWITPDGQISDAFFNDVQAAAKTEGSYNGALQSLGLKTQTWARYLGLQGADVPQIGDTMTPATREVLTRTLAGIIVGDTDDIITTRLDDLKAALKTAALNAPAAPQAGEQVLQVIAAAQLDTAALPDAGANPVPTDPAVAAETSMTLPKALTDPVAKAPTRTPDEAYDFFVRQALLRDWITTDGDKTVIAEQFYKDIKGFARVSDIGNYAEALRRYGFDQETIKRFNSNLTAVDLEEALHPEIDVSQAMKTAIQNAVLGTSADFAAKLAAQDPNATASLQAEAQPAAPAPAPADGVATGPTLDDLGKALQGTAAQAETMKEKLVQDAQAISQVAANTGTTLNGIGNTATSLSALLNGTDAAAKTDNPDPVVAQLTAPMPMPLPADHYPVEIAAADAPQNAVDAATQVAGGDATALPEDNTRLGFAPEGDATIVPALARDPLTALPPDVPPAVKRSLPPADDQVANIAPDLPAPAALPPSKDLGAALSRLPLANATIDLQALPDARTATLIASADQDVQAGLAAQGFVPLSTTDKAADEQKVAALPPDQTLKDIVPPPTPLSTPLPAAAPPATGPKEDVPYLVFGQPPFGVIQPDMPRVGLGTSGNPMGDIRLLDKQLDNFNTLMQRPPLYADLPQKAGAWKPSDLTVIAKPQAPAAQDPVTQIADNSPSLPVMPAPAAPDYATLEALNAKMVGRGGPRTAPEAKDAAAATPDYAKLEALNADMVGRGGPRTAVPATAAVATAPDDTTLEALNAKMVGRGLPRTAADATATPATPPSPDDGLLAADKMTLATETVYQMEGGRWSRAKFAKKINEAAADYVNLLAPEGRKFSGAQLKQQIENLSSAELVMIAELGAGRAAALHVLANVPPGAVSLKDAPITDALAAIKADNENVVGDPNIGPVASKLALLSKRTGHGKDWLANMIAKTESPVGDNMNKKDINVHPDQVSAADIVASFTAKVDAAKQTLMPAADADTGTQVAQANKPAAALQPSV